MRKLIFVCCGHLSLAVGFIGIFLPLLPTTPFVLLACGCYAKGSEKMHAAILRHPRFGPIIREWQEYKSIPLYAKILATIMISASITWSITLVPLLSVKILLAVIGITVSSYILTRPSIIMAEEEGKP
jgi:hypothetical protein